MFKKKTCERCGEKISDKNSFCQNCGNQLKENNENRGLLGKNDGPNEFDKFTNSIFGGISGKMINKMFGSAMKMLENEMQKEMKNQNTQPKTNFELIINGKRIDPKNIKVTRQPIQVIQKHKEQIKNILPKISPENLKKMSNLPRKEPATNIRRLANKVIYEINMPGVKSIEDVSIIQLENSIELKALGKDKTYFKLIPINLPIKDHSFSKGKLILELEAKN